MDKKHVEASPERWMLVTLAVAFVLALMVGGYGYVRLSGEITLVDMKLASTTALLQANLSAATTSLASALEQQGQNVAQVQQQLGGFQSQVGTISGTVNTLQKLSQTDPQLLAKYSKVFFLNENYAPARLIQIPQDYVYSSTKTEQIIPEVWPFLSNMLFQASSTGIHLYVASAYRSFDEQDALKGEYKVTYGVGTANSFSADQGYSEHQLGTAVDFITTGIGGDLTGFEKTTAYAWLTQNAYRFGFILSYPPNNSYYIFEPWHWRFVGVKLATDLHNQGKYFYDLDQRTIDAYLMNFFDPQ